MLASNARAQDGKIPVVPASADPRAALSIGRAKASLLGWIMASLGWTGRELQVRAGLEDLQDEIGAALDYAGDGGVLVVARMESSTTDAGTVTRLIRGRVDFVGIGRTAAEAELHRISSSQDPFYIVASGYRLDLDATRTFFFRRGADGVVTRTEGDGRSLRISMIALYGERALQGFDWDGARIREMERILAAMANRAPSPEARAEIEALGDSWREARRRLDALNVELQRQLELGGRAAANLQIVRILNAGSAALSLVQTTALQGMENTNGSLDGIIGATTPEEIAAELDAIQKGAASSADILRQEIDLHTSTTSGVETQVLTFMREREVPVQSLPPSKNSVRAPAPP